MSILLDSAKQFPDDGVGIRSNYRKRTVMLSLLWQAAPVLVLPAWIAQPLLERRYVTTGNMTELYRRPVLYMLTPGDGQASPSYEIVYVLQVVSVLIAVQTSVMMDIYFSHVLLLLAAELDVLNANIARMQLTAAARMESQSMANMTILEYSGTGRWPSKGIHLYNKNKIIEEDELHSSAPLYENTSDACQELYESLVKNVRHHQRIMICTDELEGAMSKSITIVLVVSTFVICLNAFGFVEMFQGAASRGSVVKRIVGFLVYLAHNGLFCFLGQAVTDQSERLPHSAFGCGWPDANPPFKRSLMIMMQQTSRPLIIRVGKLFTLSSNTFIQIINTSYTIFNMMLSLQ
ncbi:odorant receptor coreceptor-like [Schistocerca americana]|uniref:odorant receptor coreceptor-like n=1 Tax=Schistocerca americana TaxID=7009 RepID=UPI001F4F8E7C|nr:odorant receptor coreceptor-like [Schistocerca americana]